MNDNTLVVVIGASWAGASIIGAVIWWLFRRKDKK